jgi:hypothetical protein
VTFKTRLSEPDRTSCWPGALNFNSESLCNFDTRDGASKLTNSDIFLGKPIQLPLKWGYSCQDWLLKINPKSKLDRHIKIWNKKLLNLSFFQLFPIKALPCYPKKHQISIHSSKEKPKDNLLHYDLQLPLSLFNPPLFKQKEATLR